MAIPFYAKSEDNQGYIKNMEVIAFDDLDGGSIFQPQLWRTEEGKYYLYGTMGKNWIKQHPATAKQLGFYKDGMGRLRSKHSMGSYTALTMAMGYNVVKNKHTSNETYYTVLDRSALTTSTKNYYTQSRGMK